jgi:hypothetical protein
MRRAVKTQRSERLFEFEGDVSLLHHLVEESLKGSFQFTAQIAFGLNDHRHS